jgi:DNA primase
VGQFNTDGLREKVRLEDYVSKSISLRRYGKNLKGLCPFHDEDTPSFNINPQRQMWHCFGCGKGGDIFTFVMEERNCTFVEAAKFLGTAEGSEATPAEITPEGREWINAAVDITAVWRKVINLQDEKNRARVEGTDAARSRWANFNKIQRAALADLAPMLDRFDQVADYQPNGWQTLPLVRLQISPDLMPFISGSADFRETCVWLIAGK